MIPRPFIERKGSMRCCLKILRVLVCTCLVLLFPAWNGDVTGTSPAIHFEMDLFTFQPILEGDSVAVSFPFTNSGEEVLVIHDAVTSCGCTTANYPSHFIKPGRGGTIKTIFHSKGHSGENDIVLLVKSNDPIFPVKKLRIRGKVIRQWQAKPDRFVLTNLKPNRSYTRKLQISNFMDEPLHIRKLAAGNPHTHLLSKPKEVAPKGDEPIVFEVNVNDLKLGGIGQYSIRIEVANAKMKSVEIPILMKLK
jgi:hypothetical protein